MSAWTRLKIWGRQWRHFLRANPRLYFFYRIGVGVVGTTMLIGGIIAIPYPGPGWALVFLALGVLASEFEWARKLLRFARSKYDAFMAWMKKQHWVVQGLFGLGTCAVVIGTLWLVNAFGIVAAWFGIHASWISSPLL